MNGLQIFLKKNGRIFTVLYVILLIIALLLIIDENTYGKIMKLRENFQSGNTKPSKPKSSTAEKDADTDADEDENKPGVTTSVIHKPPVGSKLIIHNLIIFAIDNTRVDEKLPIKDKYFASFIMTSNTKGRHNNFVYTNAIKSNKWMTPGRSAPLSSKHTIIDLTYDQNRRLMAIGMSIEKDKPVFDIFKKSSRDFKSEWVKLESNRKIRSLSYDITYGSLLGINSYDGQIYESRYRALSYGDWVGPINYGLPMRKIMYDKEGYMIGIGLIDNFIYRKETKFWRESDWDKKNVNKTAVYDLIYDTDGCFIASTRTGIKKQQFPDFNSEFVPLGEFKQEHADVLDHDEILKYRTGVEFLDDDFDQNTELGRDLKRIYEFKKVAKDLCKSRGRFKKETVNPEKESVDSNTVSRQNKEINDLYDKINVLTDKLSM